MNFRWLIRTESYKRGMLFSVLFNIASKGILFLLTILVARFFGSDIKTDIYFFVYSSMILFSGFINTIDTAVLVPESMRLREREGDEAAAGFLNFFLRVYFFIGIAFIGVMFFFGTMIFGLISKFPEADILLYKNYFLLGSLYFLFQVLTNFINSILTSLKFFTVPMIISAINSCIVIAGILLLHQQFNVLSVFIGGIAAYSLNLIFLLILMKGNLHWNFFTRTTMITKRVWSNILFSELGQLATLVSSFFPLFLLSGFGNGVISVMNYGKNIADIPNTLITSQLSNVSGIQLNEQAARQDRTGMNDTFVHTGKLLLFILIPVGCYLFVFAEPVTRLFYFRGSFTETAVHDSAKFLQLLSITIFSIGINSLVSRVFIATQAIKQAFLYQLILNVLLIAAIWIFTKYYGAYGYPYGIILVNVVNYIAMYFICKKLVRQIKYAPLLKYTVLLILINASIATGLYFAAPYLHTGLFGNLIIIFLVYLFILLALNKKFHLNSELSQAMQYVQKEFI